MFRLLVLSLLSLILSSCATRDLEVAPQPLVPDTTSLTKLRHTLYNAEDHATVLDERYQVALGRAHKAGETMNAAAAAFRAAEAAARAKEEAIRTAPAPAVPRVQPTGPAAAVEEVPSGPSPEAVAYWESKREMRIHEEEVAAASILRAENQRKIVALTSRIRQVEQGIASAEPYTIILDPADQPAEPEAVEEPPRPIPVAVPAPIEATPIPDPPELIKNDMWW